MHSPHCNQRSSPGTGVGVTSSVMRCPQRLLITGHRPVLDALLGSPHTHRRDDAGARRFGAQRKVRYIGFSDTPAWKVVEAQMRARFHGWAPVAAIQISYSLAERTVEGDLIPMAREFGIGVTPWSPLCRRRADWKVHPPERVDRDRRSRRASDVRVDRTKLRHRRRADPGRSRSQLDAGRRRSRLGADTAGRDVDDHRGPAPRPARSELGRRSTSHSTPLMSRL